MKTLEYNSSAQLVAAFKKWRKDNGLSIRVVAKETDINYATLHAIEKGKVAEVGYDKALKMIEVMKMPIKKTSEVRGSFK